MLPISGRDEICQVHAALPIDKAYAHLSVADREAMISRLTRLHTGEMEPYYIMRYGFYEGHTAYRVDPIAVSVLFGLKSLADIDQAFHGRLDQVLTTHFSNQRLKTRH